MIKIIPIPITKWIPNEDDKSFLKSSLLVALKTPSIIKVLIQNQPNSNLKKITNYNTIKSWHEYQWWYC